MQLTQIQTWKDTAFRSAAENMALDEALFRHAAETGIPMARFYNWDHPAVTVGYFFEKEGITPPPGAVRRYTGGGLVEHGEDLTFALAIPAAEPFTSASAEERYRFVHESLIHALTQQGMVTDPTLLGPGPNPVDSTANTCFTKPVLWDIIDPTSGEKIGGGAQRRSKGAVLHQGSVRLPTGMREVTAPWIDTFSQKLGKDVDELQSGKKTSISDKAKQLKAEKYSTPEWSI